MWFARYGSNSCSDPVCKNCFFTVLNKSSHKCEFTNSALTAGFFFIAFIIFFEIMAYLLPCAVHLAGNGRYMHHTYIQCYSVPYCSILIFTYIHIHTYVYGAWLHGGENSVRLDLFTRLIGRVVSQFWDFIVIKIVVNDVANN